MILFRFDAGTGRIHFSTFLHTQTFPLPWLAVPTSSPCPHYSHHVHNLAPGPMLRAALSRSAVINPTAALHCSITQRCVIIKICHLIDADTTCETEFLRSTLQLNEYFDTLLPPAPGGYKAAFPEPERGSEWPWGWEMGDDMRLIIMS